MCQSCFHCSQITALYDKVDIPQEEKAQPNNLVVILSSDRGLCGGIHSGLVKAFKAMVAEKQGLNTKIVAVGDKARQILQRTHGRDHNSVGLCTLALCTL